MDTTPVVVPLYMEMTFGYYKKYLYTHRYKLSAEKKRKKKVKSPIIWFCTPKPIWIRQSGQTGNRGVTRTG